LQALINQGMIGEMTQKAEPIIKQTEVLMASSNELLKTFTDSKKEISEMLANFNQISASLKNTLARGEIDQILSNTRILTESLQKLTQQVAPLMTKSNTLLDKFNALEIEKTVTQANQAMLSINQSLSAINEGKGTIGALLKSDTLVRNVNKTLLDLDKVFIDLRENPKRYISISLFPKKEKKEKK
jgi:phospholipid/cholesterol/gamma-HCH transport system substrate-binding protein